jgi:hypothetical protein
MNAFFTDADDGSFFTIIAFNQDGKQTHAVYARTIHEAADAANELERAGAYAIRIREENQE